MSTASASRVHACATSRSVHTGTFQRGASARASTRSGCSRARAARSRESGTGTSAARSAITSGGQASARHALAPSPSATRCQPSYLSACTIDAPRAARQPSRRERTARTYGGSSVAPRGSDDSQRSIGCPHRSQRGRGSSAARAQHAPQTSIRARSRSRASLADGARARAGAGRASAGDADARTQRVSSRPISATASPHRVAIAARRRTSARTRARPAR